MRVGDKVRVRTLDQIMATLDDTAAIDNLPFMPEMVRYCGREIEIYRSAHKTCDSVNKQGNTLEMRDAYHLVGARCDGADHDGCQARCMHFWKGEWLETLDGRPLTVSPGSRSTRPVTIETITAGSRKGTGPAGETLYRCSATEMAKATTIMHPFSARLYLADIRSGNATAREVARVVAMTLFNKYQGLSRRFLPAALRIRGGLPYPFAEGRHQGAKSVPAAKLDLKPGEPVRVRRKDELLPILNKDLTNRGLWFDPEQFEWCGHEAKVLGSIEKIIDEPTGKMIALKDCIILDGVVCDGWLHRFCPRSDYTYWREGWLERVSPSPADAPG